jgi:hypothetical protein
MILEKHCYLVSFLRMMQLRYGLGRIVLSMVEAEAVGVRPRGALGSSAHLSAELDPHDLANENHESDNPVQCFRPCHDVTHAGMLRR